MTRPRVTALTPVLSAAVLALAVAAPPGLLPSASSSALRTVAFGGVEVQVPAAWPVVDFTSDPVGCLRLDRNVVYLGTPTVSDCPAHLVGAVETVQIAFTPPTPGAHAGGRNSHGVAWTEAGAVGTPGTVQVSGDAAHASVTITSAGSDATTRAIADSVRHVGQASPPAPPLVPVAATSTTTAATYTTGGGFDACSAPSVQQMQAWLASPYRSVGVYVGGVNRACSQPNLTATWVTQVTGMGWSLIPTYVGLQAPCTTFNNRMSASSAASQGAQAANDAVNVMTALGLGPGNPVYDDMESYNTSNSSCVAAVEAFQDAWTQRLHALGYVSGFYSSAASGITNMVQKSSDPTYHLPDDIWFAHWNGSNTVYDDSYIPNTLWANHQRIHQYRGGHNETYGGVTINIDNDAVDGATGSPAGGHRVPSDVNGDGRSDLCVFTGVNGFATASGKLELHCLGGASTYTRKLFDVSTAYGYVAPRLQLPLSLDDDGDGRTDVCLLTGLNGSVTPSGRTEVHCANASGGFATSSLDVPTAWPYLDTHTSYPVGLDVNGDGKTDLCVYTGIDGHTTPSGHLEVHCLDAATSYSTSLVDAVTPFGYANTWNSLPIGLDYDGDGKTDACLLTGLNGGTTASGRLEVRCASAASGFTSSTFAVSTPSGYLDTRYSYPIALDVNGDGRTDLCIVTGLNGAKTPSGRLEIRCYNGATNYSTTLISVATPYSYLQSGANAFLADAPVTVDVVAPRPVPGALPPFYVASPLVFPYGAVDFGTGVASYDVRYRVAPLNGGFGSFVYPAAWQNRAVPAVAIGPIRGATYCFSLRARDHSRNLSGWSAERCTSAALDDRSLVASAGWLKAGSPAYYAGTISRANSIGRTLTRTGVQAHRIEILATTCRACGAVAVYWNGHLLKQLSLTSRTTIGKALVGVTIFRGVQSGTLVIRSLNAGYVFIDGVFFSRT